jgi:tetratricopeptide (TPR) repeat protein
MMRETGLAREHFEYLRQVRDRVSEGTGLFGRLTSHMAMMMGSIDELRADAEQAHQAALNTFQKLDENLVREGYAEALIAYGRHLIETDNLNGAAQHYQKAITLLNNQGLQAAVAEGELGRAYVGRGRFQESLPHFENALAKITDADEHADERARVQADYAAALIQLGDLAKAEEVLNKALEACNRFGLWSLRGQVRRELAYIDQLHAEQAQDPLVAQSFWQKAYDMLNQTITDLLPISDSLGLAVAYHDLGRLEAHQRKFADALNHVKLSTDMFERLGNLRNLAVAEVTLGQIVVLKNGDATTANQHLHRALTLASQLDDQHTRQTAAESLVRIHQFQAKHAVSELAAVRHQVLDQITFSRAKLNEMGLSQVVEKLNPLISQLEAVEKSGDVSAN